MQYSAQGPEFVGNPGVPDPLLGPDGERRDEQNGKEPMIGPSFSSVFTVDRSPEVVFAALNNVRGWWSANIEGETDKLGDEFTHRY